LISYFLAEFDANLETEQVAERKKAITMYNNNSGFIAKIKVSIFVQRLVINRKVCALQSATIFILNVSKH
jgi:hypothetical protein